MYPAEIEALLERRGGSQGTRQAWRNAPALGGWVQRESRHYHSCFWTPARIIKATF